MRRDRVSVNAVLQICIFLTIFRRKTTRSASKTEDDDVAF